MASTGELPQIIWAATFWDNNTISLAVNGRVNFRDEATFAFSDGAGFFFVDAIPLREG